MLTSYYSQYDFEELSKTEQWSAYLRLRHYAENLQKKLDAKAERVESKVGKIDYLRAAKAELIRQQAARNIAGANARNARYTASREQFIATYLELKAERDRKIKEAETGNWQAPPKRLTAEEVLDAYNTRISGDFIAIKLPTARRYLRDYSTNQNIAPELQVILN